jgi:hemolysin activation/secretion protein
MQRSLAVAAVLALISTGSAEAQTSPSRVVPPGRIDQAPPKAPKRIGKTPRRQKAPVPQIQSFQLSDVRISGSSLSAERLRAAYAPFLGRTLTSPDLQKLTDAVAAAYERADVALYTVLVPEQDFSGGVLQLVAVEGYVSAVLYDGAGKGATRAIRPHAEALQAERPLSRTTLQREVSLMRDIPGLNPEIGMRPGTQQGAVEVAIDAHPKPVQFGVSVNNRGTAYLGRTQAQADLYFNGVLGGGDQTRLSYAAPTDGNFFRYYGAGHSRILDKAGTTLNLDATYLTTKPRGTALKGKAASLSVQLSRPLIRSYDTNLYVTLGLDGLNADNALLGQTLSNDRVRAFRAGVAWSKASEKQFFALTGAFSQGIDGLGARASNPAYAKSGFTKVNARAAFNQAIGQRWVVRTTGSAQAAFDPLPGSEQFALGGDEFGRGYESAYLAGDSGWAASAELVYRPEKTFIPAVADPEIYGFVDGGQVKRKARPGLLPASDASLSSTGAGVRMSIAGKATLQVEAVRGLEQPEGAPDRRDWRGVVTLSTLF